MSLCVFHSVVDLDFLSPFPSRVKTSAYKDFLVENPDSLLRMIQVCSPSYIVYLLSIHQTTFTLCCHWSTGHCGPAPESYSVCSCQGAGSWVRTLHTSRDSVGMSVTGRCV